MASLHRGVSPVGLRPVGSRRARGIRRLPQDGETREIAILQEGDGAAGGAQNAGRFGQQPVLREGAQQGIASEHHPGIAVRERPAQGKGSLGESSLLHLAERAGPHDGAGTPQGVREFQARPRADVPDGALDGLKFINGGDASIGPLPDEIRRQVDRVTDRVTDAIGVAALLEEFERIVAGRLSPDRRQEGLGHLSTHEHRIGAQHQRVEVADAVQCVAAPEDDHQRAVRRGEQWEEQLDVRLELTTGGAGEQARRPDDGGQRHGGSVESRR